MDFNEKELKEKLRNYCDDVDYDKLFDEAKKIFSIFGELTDSPTEDLQFMLIESYILAPELDFDQRISFLIGYDYSLKRGKTVGIIEQDIEQEILRRNQELIDTADDQIKNRINKYTRMGIAHEVNSEYIYIEEGKSYY